MTPKKTWTLGDMRDRLAALAEEYGPDVPITVYDEEDPDTWTEWSTFDIVAIPIRVHGSPAAAINPEIVEVLITLPYTSPGYWTAKGHTSP